MPSEQTNRVWVAVPPSPRIGPPLAIFDTPDARELIEGYQAQLWRILGPYDLAEGSLVYPEHVQRVVVTGAMMAGAREVLKGHVPEGVMGDYLRSALQAALDAIE